MKLWGGRFTKEINQLAYQLNASIGFDQRLYKQDIEGSLAHVTMLAKQGILADDERDAIINGLKSILADLENQTLQIDDSSEDIHSFVEANLIARIGEVGKKLHTGRSRNDQVALDMKLYIRSEITELDHLLKELLQTLLHLMEEHIETYMPGFTHLQKAQPITLAHHLGAYFEMFRRDRDRLFDIYNRLNYCPLGAGALAGTTYPLDREFTAELLGFDGATLNSLDSVSDRDYLIELLSALSTIMMHLSRFSEEIIIWNTNEYRFVEIDDAYSTGSSIMPQKKNPDMAELVRGKTGRVYGALFSLLTTMKGLPLAYNKDMQEDKELTFDALDTVKSCLPVFTDMIRTMRFRKDIMESSAKNGFTNATETETGIRTYKCSVCGYVMQEEMIDRLPPSHTHNYGTEWKSDADSHWYECSCGNKSELASHIEDGGSVTKAPTETETGVMTYKCRVCGYVIRTADI